MAVLPMLKMTGGLHTGPLTAGPDHCVDSINFMSAGGSLVKRSGSRPLQNIMGIKSLCYVGSSVGTALPSLVKTASSTHTFGSNDTTVYVGAATKFNLFNLYGRCRTRPLADYVDWWSVTPEYWNGSTWDTLQIGWLDTKYEAGSISQIGPMYGYTADPSLPYFIGHLMRGVFVPPPAWASLAIAGQTKYWIRIRGLPKPQSAGTNYITLNNPDPSTWVQTTENRILNVLTFCDMRGARHLFIAYLFGSGQRELRFELDGVVLSQGVGLQPDGNESAGTGSRMFSPATRVNSFYHAVTDRVIGHVQGLGWFYFLATTLWINGYGTRFGEVYALRAGGTNTAYAGVDGGLRSALPSGVISVMHDGRIFAFEDQTARWSAPTKFPDVWPNNNELFLSDAGGNVTGAVSVGGVLAVLKRNAIWVMQSDGSSDGYVAYPVPGNIGCVAPRSVVAAGNVAYFLAEDGVYSFDGQVTSKISGNIDGLIGTKEFSSNAEDAIGVWAPQHNQYRLFYRSSASSGVMDAALYCDVTDPRNPSWWKQGKYSATDYGFNATAAVADFTTDSNNMLIGDAYGVLWECDVGVRDAGSPVKARLVSQRIGLGSTRKALVRWVNVTQKNVGNYTWAVKVWTEGKEDEKVSHTYNPRATSPAGTFGAMGTFGTNTFAYARDRQVVQGSFAQLGRHFQLELIDENAAPLEVDAIEVDANPLGRRGA